MKPRAVRIVRTQLVAPALELVAMRGGDVGRLLRTFDLPDNARSEAEIDLPLQVLHAFHDAAAREARDPLFGVHMAQLATRGIHGVLEFMCRTTRTLRDAMTLIAQYGSSMSRLAVVTFEHDDDRAVLEERVPGEPLSMGRHANEFLLVKLVRGAREITGTRCAPVRVWFAHPRPRPASVVAALAEELGTPHIRFDAGANGMAVDRAFLEMPVLGHDPPLLAVLDAYAKSALEARPGSDLRAVVRRRIRERIPKPVTAAWLAREMRMSTRTLQRRLADDRIAFHELVDDVRHELARERLADPSAPVKTVAADLGYSDVRAFLRAFKRWTGMTPATFRAQR